MLELLDPAVISTVSSIVDSLLSSLPNEILLLLVCRPASTKILLMMFSSFSVLPPLEISKLRDVLVLSDCSILGSELLVLVWAIQD